jgi:hypothetical protein
MTTCLVDGKPIGGGGEQFKFQICGTVGMDGEPVGCPNEIVNANLAITLAVDNGDPEQCGKATTLDVDAGERVNVCYTITNSGDTALGFHWLRDNLNTRRLSRGRPFPALQPGESFHFNRLMTATRSQMIAAESQVTDVLPWYFAVIRLRVRRYLHHGHSSRLGRRWLDQRDDAIPVQSVRRGLRPALHQ